MVEKIEQKKSQNFYKDLTFFLNILKVFLAKFLKPFIEIFNFWFWFWTDKAGSRDADASKNSFFLK